MDEIEMLLAAAARSPVLCPRCEDEFEHAEEVYASCPYCGKSVELAPLSEEGGVWRLIEPPAEWPCYLPEAAPIEISEELLAAAELVHVILRDCDERYPAGHLRYASEVSVLRAFLEEHELQVGTIQTVSERQARGLRSAAFAVRRVAPGREDAMLAANELERAELVWSYQLAQVTPAGPQASAARELLAAMKEISEDAYCAQWLAGQEYTIWQGAHGGLDSESRWAVAITPGRAHRIRELAEEAGGWWSWPCGDWASARWVCAPTPHYVFVPIEVWREHVGQVVPAQKD